MKRFSLFIITLLSLSTFHVHGQDMKFKKKLNGYVFKNAKGITNKDLVFEDVYYLNSKYWKVKLDGKYGLFSSKGTFQLEPVYEDIIRIKESSAIVQIDGLVGVISLDGNYILQPKFDAIDHFDALIEPNSPRSTLVKLNGKWGGWKNDQFIESNNLTFIHPSSEPVLDYCKDSENPETCLYGSIFRNLTYPLKARENRDQGNVVIVFIINKDGSMTEPQILRSVTPELDAESIRVVSQTFKMWKPGLLEGNPVRTRYILPIRFKLE